MKLAIHNGLDKKVSWNTRWIDYCENNNIPYIGVDCYSSDIIKTLKEEKITHLMWAFSLLLPKDHIMARSVLYSANKMGIKTFPDFDTCWHFEDKIAQKYLLESINAPIVNSWAFFEEKNAINFANNTKYPIVAKLRKGAGSKNVILLRNKKEAISYIKKMFKKGEKPTQTIISLGKDKLNYIVNKKKINYSILDVCKKSIIHLKRRNLFAKEIGYVYFQEFLPNNLNDLRIAIVGNRAWGFYRGVRKNDFRASGSGIIDYQSEIPIDIIKCSFDITKKLNSQSMSFDYVKNEVGDYKIVEICYGYVSQAIYDCNGYWDENLKFHQSHFMPDECILNDFYCNYNK